ncbi:hypothetical protein BGZ54_002752 [Gamsiella multidivaricata]|nr:hypothetical protein BGZ54_002752 [Gamsiella multidivaricata]
MRISHQFGFILVASVCSLFLDTAPVLAAPDPIIQTCYNIGCSSVVSLLEPCGGGATNSSLQQDFIYTPTQSLGGCECNSQFYGNFSSCLACINSQGINSPEIQNEQDWVGECQGFGFNYTISPAIIPTNGGNGTNGGSGGLSKGAIAGIVIGALALLALVGASIFILCRRRKQQKKDQDFGGTSAGAATGAAAAAATSVSPYNNTDYPASYDHHDEYYVNQHAAYEDPSAQQYQSQHYGDFPGQQQYHPNDYQNDDYYGMDGHNDAMMMQNLDNNGAYVPPPPHPPATQIPTTAAAAATGAAAGYAIAAPRPSDQFPQSLRSKPKGWDRDTEPVSGLVSTDPTMYNDKMEFEDGENLEPPHSRNDREEFAGRRSMTPPRANMQSYRDEFNRPSFEREPRRSGSDRGSVSRLNLARASMDNANTYGDYGQQADEHQFSRGAQDSPESAHRRARAAELFSAEEPLSLKQALCLMSLLLPLQILLRQVRLHLRREFARAVFLANLTTLAPEQQFCNATSLTRY